ncbi:MAG: T9SS type A sorting domain-containing protein, partial [Gammaproteobacteria bacterium]|nr:T9SS type A sorting domain-containing protein [Gammaproteobacteria bacterium]
TNPIDMSPDKTGEFSVRVYPNPVSRLLTIEVSNVPAGDYHHILCSLVNAYGDLVAQQSISPGTTQLNVSGFPKGLYTVVITADGVKNIEKLIIDRHPPKYR